MALPVNCFSSYGEKTCFKHGRNCGCKVSEHICKGGLERAVQDAGSLEVHVSTENPPGWNSW